MSERRYNTQRAVLEVRLEVVDPYSRRQRWNGNPMESAAIAEVLLGAVDSLRETVHASGVDIVRTSYGVTAA